MGPPGADDDPEWTPRRRSRRGPLGAVAGVQQRRPPRRRRLPAHVVELRLPIDLAAFATAALATVLIASDQGAYFERTWPWAGLGLAAGGALALRAVDELRVTRASLLLVGATVAICVWTFASWLWSSEPATRLDEALRAPI